MKTILSNINITDFETELMELIGKLATSEYSNQKHSAIILIPVILKHMGTINKNILLG